MGKELLNEVKYDSFQMNYIEQVLECWNNTLVNDLITKQRFIENILLDENFNPKLFKVAIFKNQIIGFCFGIKRKIPYLERGLEPKRGWINMVGVDSKYQNIGIGTMLVKQVEEELKQLGSEEITLCAYSPNYFTPGIDVKYEKGINFFEKNGYIFKGEAVSMQKNLFDYNVSDDYYSKVNALQSEGIKIIPFEEKYLLSLIDYALINFGSGWKRNILMALQKGEANDTILLCVDVNDNIIGFCMRKIDGHDERFGPIGVSEELRSKGLGGILFETMMMDMKSRGIPSLYFLWTSGAAQRFYERHGVKVYRKYRLYRKEI
ncbi:MAG: GNAT family N-acetyltransferase [Erysipelotrichaceae bacterium]|nr:GNAT family N-acetyltransferase [Erysipelotrichaceae bacterium]MDY5252765.1 GNAT family N-acetyltransferase [Erysipelotrichaceae bacterium]